MTPREIGESMSKRYGVTMLSMRRDWDILPMELEGTRQQCVADGVSEKQAEGIARAALSAEWPRAQIYSYAARGIGRLIAEREWEGENR